MANSATITGAISATANGASAVSSASWAYTASGHALSKETKDLTSSVSALSFGAITSVGALMIRVLTGSGTQYVTLSLDNPQTQVISRIPEGGFVILAKPTSTLPTSPLYASANTGTITIEITAVEL